MFLPRGTLQYGPDLLGITGRKLWIVSGFCIADTGWKAPPKVVA